jgi:Zn-finger nucleic acid-binding protein
VTSSTRNAVENARTRIPCPACLGVQMTKIRPEGDAELWLDHCLRCGGIWFDDGEVEMLRAAHPRAIATKVRISEAASRMQCHSCHASMARNLSKCTACGWQNVLDCPRCEKPLTPLQQDGLKIDVCKSCRGAWFDNSELAEIWNRSVSAAAARNGVEPEERFFGGYFLVDALMWHSVLGSHHHGASVATDVAGMGAAGVGEAVAGAGIGEVAGGVVGGIGDAAGGVVDSVGEAAGGFFDSIAGIFDGFDF